MDLLPINTLFIPGAHMTRMCTLSCLLATLFLPGCEQVQETEGASTDYLLGEGAVNFFFTSGEGDGIDGEADANGVPRELLEDVVEHSPYFACTEDTLASWAWLHLWRERGVDLFELEGCAVAELSVDDLVAQSGLVGFTFWSALNLTTEGSGVVLGGTLSIDTQEEFYTLEQGATAVYVPQASANGTILFENIFFEYYNSGHHSTWSTGGPGQTMSVNWALDTGARYDCESCWW